MGREVVIWRISRCLDSNICWNSRRKYSNGGFVALARPTQRAASVRGKRGEIFCFENLNFYSWNDYFKHLAHGLGWLVSFQFVFPKFSKLGVFRVLCCIPPTLGKIFRRGFRGFGSLCTFLLSSPTAWERRRLLMLTSTFIAAWRLGEGLLTPNLKRRARPRWGASKGGLGRVRPLTPTVHVLTFLYFHKFS